MGSSDPSRLQLRSDSASNFAYPAPAPLRLLLSVFKTDSGSGSSSGSSSGSDLKMISFSLIFISMGFLGFQVTTIVKKIIDMKRNEEQMKAI
jgi:hypothetical protein